MISNSIYLSFDIPSCCRAKTPTGFATPSLYAKTVKIREIALWILMGMWVGCAAFFAFKALWVPLIMVGAAVHILNIAYKLGIISQGSSLDKPGFKRESERAGTIDFKSELGKTYIRQALESLSQHGYHTLIAAWEIEQSKGAPRDPIDLFATELQDGTCYGQTMTILEFLSAEKEVSAGNMMSYLKPQKFIYYQIVHLLHVFLSKQKSRYAFGVEVNPALQKLVGLLPNHGRLIGKSGKFSLKEDSFPERLQDFPRQVNLSEETPFAITLTLLSDNDGHSMIVYYDNLKKNYYLYDPYSSFCGLFGSNERKVFFAQVIKHINEVYSSTYTRINLQAYQLESARK